MFEDNWVLFEDLWCNFVRDKFLGSENDALCQTQSEFYNFVSCVITEHIFPLHLSVPTKVNESVVCIAASRSGR